MEKLIESATSVQWEEINSMTSVDEMLSFINTEILKVFDQLAPQVTKRVTRK